MGWSANKQDYALTREPNKFQHHTHLTNQWVAREHRWLLKSFNAQKQIQFTSLGHHNWTWFFFLKLVTPSGNIHSLGCIQVSPFCLNIDSTNLCNTPLNDHKHASGIYQKDRAASLTKLWTWAIHWPFVYLSLPGLYLQSKQEYFTWTRSLCILP